MAAFKGDSFEELRWAYRQRWTDGGCLSSGVVAQHAAAARLHAATDRWEFTRLAAVAAAKPDGYCLETSFSSAQPMHGWTLQHAVRELWQNLRDGAADAFGPGPLVPRFSIGGRALARMLHGGLRDKDTDEEGEENEKRKKRRGEGGGAASSEMREAYAEAPMLGRIELSCGGVSVGSVDAAAPDTLVFQQRFATLQPRHLLLAGSKAGSSAGAHGEGFKVAANLLLRHGYSVTYTMDGQRWSFVHRPLHSADALTMVVEMSRTHESSSDLVVEVQGPGAGALFCLEQDWEIAHAAVAVAEGSALVAHLTLRTPLEAAWTQPLFAGRVYCRNLFVGIDEGLRSLGLAMNLDFPLQRDRHALPHNLPAVVGRALMALGALHGHAAPPFAALCKHVLGAFMTRAGGLQDYAPHLREMLRAHVAAREGCELRDVVFLASAERVGEGLSGLGLVLVQCAGELADRMNKREILLDCVSRMADWEPAPGSRQDIRRGWLLSLLGAVAGLGGLPRVALCVKAIPAGPPCAPFVRLSVAGIDGPRCYVSSRLLEEPPSWRVAAQLLATEMAPSLVQRDAGPLLAQFVARFMENPVEFAAAGWRAVPRGAIKQTGPSGTVAVTGVTGRQTPVLFSSRLLPGADSTSRKPRLACGPTLQATQSHAEAGGGGEGRADGGGWEAALCLPTCGGATLSFPGAPPPDGDFIEPPPPCACIPPLSRLVARNVAVAGGAGPLRTLYIDAAVLEEANTGPLDEIVRALPQLLGRFDAIVRR